MKIQIQMKIKIQMKIQMQMKIQIHFGTVWLTRGFTKWLEKAQNNQLAPSGWSDHCKNFALLINACKICHFFWLKLAKYSSWEIYWSLPIFLFNLESGIAFFHISSYFLIFFLTLVLQFSYFSIFFSNTNHVVLRFFIFSIYFRYFFQH